MGLSAPSAEDSPLGIFQGHGEVGKPAKPGSVRFVAPTGDYSVAGGGSNMWFAADAFHFVWRRLSGDILLSADIRWPRPGGNLHRKACLLLRQSLAPDSPYADAALHGNGLASLQFREETGAATREIQSNASGPGRLRIERYGDFVSMSVAAGGSELRPAGGAIRMRFQDPVYVGLGVCAHDDSAQEEAVFSNVSLVAKAHVPRTNLVVESTLEVVSIASQDRRVVYHTRDHIEAPNWMPDGQHLLFNSQGRLYRIPVEGGAAELVDTGFANRCNNDHGISPNGATLAISDSSETGKSLIYVLPITGGTPRKVTPLGPSYWHGWSPDGRTLVYCAERNGEYDVYAIAVAGGEEERLTTAPGLDDGPEYSPDGQFIYFNSERTGRMQIWRMRPNGAEVEQVTFDEHNDWFPHVSPDGRWMVFLSYGPEVKGHPPNQDVLLRLLPIGKREPQVLARLFGGQGTINVPSWSPDSRGVAFVSYRLVPPGGW
jgi:hypothetical protein